MKRHFANMVFALILAAYTVYAALDTFVIVRVLTPDTLPTATGIPRGTGDHRAHFHRHGIPR